MWEGRINGAATPAEAPLRKDRRFVFIIQVMGIMYEDFLKEPGIPKSNA
jgi:hypothetical protein